MRGGGEWSGEGKRREGDAMTYDNMTGRVPRTCG